MKSGQFNAIKQVSRENVDKGTQSACRTVRLPSCMLGFLARLKSQVFLPHARSGRHMTDLACAAMPRGPTDATQRQKR